MIHPEPGRTDNIKLAVYAILFTVLALSFGDALIKQVSSDLVLWQIFVVRSACAIPIVIVLATSRASRVLLLPKAIGWTALRSLMLTTMWVAYYAALPHVPFSVAAAAFYTLSLFITLFSALFTADRVSVRGWFAVVFGFVGVLLILRPDTDEFNAYALLPIGSAILYALSMILTRTKCQHEAPLVLSLGLNLSFVCVGLLATLLVAAVEPSVVTVDAYPFLLGDWSAMALREWLAMGVMATAVIVGSVGAAIAYQSGPSAMVSTFDFAYVGFAMIWGVIFFTEIPGAITVVGMLMIVVAGVVAVRR